MPSWRHPLVMVPICPYPIVAWRGPYRGSVTRTRQDDACPGALQMHRAADGLLARVRLPGGMIAAEQLAALADTATRFAAGTLELTARGNLQLRGITDDPGVAEDVAQAVAAAGLLPSATHERVRNIVASPLSGRVGGLTDIRGWVAALDSAVQDDPALAELPGRFLFGIDDGSADTSGLAADAGVHVLAGGVALLLAGRDSGVRLRADEAVPSLLEVARRFVRLRGTAWRVAELDDPGILLTGYTPSVPAGRGFEPARPPIGWIDQTDGAVTIGALVPLGVLTARQAQFVAAIGSPVVVTPRRSLLVCDLTEDVADTAVRVLAPMGLVFDATSRWLDVTACVGSPGCERSRADVRADARADTGALATRAVGDGAVAGTVHYVGCERACGRPAFGTVLVATGQGAGRYLPLPPKSR